MQYLIHPTLPLFDAGTMTLCREVGGGTLMALFEGVNDGDYVDYLMSLRDDGFAVKASREVVGNRYIRLTREAQTVTMFYAVHARTLRVFLDATSARELADPAAETVTTPTLTMIGRKFTEKSTYLGCDSSMGLTCFVFRLSDGSFIVYDGGVEIDAFADAILETMRAQAPDPDRIVVRGWILSHSHCDHVGGIRRFCRKYPGAVELRRVLCSFPSDIDTDRADEVGMTAAYQNATFTAIREGYPDAAIIRLHTGDCFKLGDAEIEVLYTQEEFFTPARVRRGNHYWNDTSLACRITLGGQRIMMLGDTHITANTILTDTWGAHLKSDLVQVAHHGGDGGTSALYSAIDADFAFFGTSDELVPVYINFPYNHHMVYDLHLRGYANAAQRTMTFPLPYTPPVSAEGPVFVRELNH